MQIRQLRHFLAAVETGSMTLASAAQNITQPTLSRSIHTLEEELGVDLFERGHRGVLPTRYGELLAEHARSIIHGVDQAIEDVGAMRAGGLGHVRLGIGSTATDPRIAQACAQMAVADENITLSLDYDVPETQFARLRRGELDAIIDTLRVDLDSGDLNFRPLTRLDMVLVARRGHPILDLARKSGPIAARDLAHWPWAIFNQPNAEAFYRGLMGLAEEEHNIRVRSSSPAMLRQLLLNADLVGLMDRTEIADCLADGRLQEIATDMRRVEATLCVVTRRRTYMSGALRVVIQRLHDAL
ncbi:LysR family transcriptional regulator [Novosphingobium guangzhouense]|uniref:Transcriptional regulator n=1 Tax=Novosphingobium guangzhouense TaxID=1850347 RepID=A0A2K2FXI3_9SPHN|nr:LysR family transcriptional regulator [Novosphingobium guangzhouense]PNU03495.1 transcriptional regulator [Novosphingobium guangzhouense]